MNFRRFISPTLFFAMAMLNTIAAAQAQNHTLEENCARKADHPQRAAFYCSHRRIKIIDERPIISDFRELGPPELPPSGFEALNTATSRRGVSRLKQSNEPILTVRSTLLATTRTPSKGYSSGSRAGIKVEPGLVTWHKDFTEACKRSAQTKKPVLLLQLVGKLDDEFC
jgi:hypothetical protein